MADFSHLRKHIGAEKTATYTFYDLEGEPTVSVRPATEENKDYHNALMRRQLSRSRKSARRITVDDLMRVRKDDIELYAQHIVKGWEGIVDAAGKAVAFSEATCKEFLTAIPTEILDDLRGFCADRHSFLDGADADGEALGKN